MVNKRSLEFQNFDLQKVKVTKEGINVDFYEKGNGNDKHTIECVGIAHPDLINAVASLDLYLALRLDILSGWDFARENTRDNLEVLAQAKKGYDDAIERCKTSGISYAGNGQLRAVKITGTLKCGNQSIGLASPNVTFSSEKLGYEKDVESICDKINEEVYNYIFKNKRAQQDLVQQAEEAEETNEPVGQLKDDKEPSRRTRTAAKKDEAAE